MRKLNAILMIGVAVAIAAPFPAMAKGAKSNSSGKLYEHTATGVHIKEGNITAEKTSQPRPSDINVTKTTDKASAK